VVIQHKQQFAGFMFAIFEKFLCFFVSQVEGITYQQIQIIYNNHLYKNTQIS